MQDHPKVAEFLNYPIRFYSEMEAIFANAMATGSLHLDLVNPQDKSLLIVLLPRLMALLFLTAPSLVNKEGGGSKANEVLPTSTSVAGSKRKRGNFSEDEMLMFTNMSDVVNNVANALRDTGPAHVDANLYLVVMEMPRFTEEALIVAHTFLLDNKAQGTCFVNISDAHRTLWLRTFLDKNYYG
jgi:hypothetical protein